MTSDRAGVEKEEVTVGDLQNKVPPKVGGGGFGKILRQSSQLFWPIRMECLGKSAIKFWKEEESLEKMYLEDSFL